MTQADRELDWATGRELERKDAEIEQLRATLNNERANAEDLRQNCTRVVAENERLQAREKLLDSVIARQALALMKIRTMQGDPIPIAREAMDEPAAEQTAESK